MNPNFIIFTDGSLRQWTDKETSTKMIVAGYGVAIIDLATLRYTSFGGPIHTKSIPFAETWAIYRGLQFMNGICKKKDIKPKALVVSDNKNVVSAFNEYIPFCWDTSDWSHWKLVGGGSVKNQDLFRNIMELMDDNKMRIKFAHINGHLKKTDWIVVAKKLQFAGITCSSDISELFIEMNSLADKTASDITHKMRKENGKTPDSKKSKLDWKEIGDVIK